MWDFPYNLQSMGSSLEFLHSHFENIPSFMISRVFIMSYMIRKPFILFES